LSSGELEFISETPIWQVEESTIFTRLVRRSPRRTRRRRPAKSVPIAISTSDSTEIDGVGREKGPIKLKAGAV
jgi:hypothetical protein